jgi:tetratricopeptide (TPR) repeat protein
VTDTALLAVLLAAIAGLLAGRAWAEARRRGEPKDRPPYRVSPHYTQGLHYVAAGQRELAISELTKVAREDPEALEVLQILGNLLREAGQVEKAIQVHQGLLARTDLTRAERAYALASLGADFRKAGFLDRATRTFEEVLEVDPKNIHALVGMQKLHEDQRQWKEAYTVQTRLSRLRKTEDSLVLGHLQAEMGREALQAGRIEIAEKAFRTALSLDRRVFPAHLGLADCQAGRDPRQAAAILEDAVQIAPERAYLRPPRPRVRRQRRAVALREPLREDHPPGPARLARAAGAGPPPRARGPARGGLRPAAAGGGSQPTGAAPPPRDVADAARDGARRGRRGPLHRGGGGIGLLPRPPRLHGVPLPRRRHAVAVPALPRVEHVRRGAPGPHLRREGLAQGQAL